MSKPDLGTVVKYLKVRALAEHPGTPPNERDQASRTLGDMETEYEGIADASRRVLEAMDGRPAGLPTLDDFPDLGQFIDTVTNENVPWYERALQGVRHGARIYQAVVEHGTAPLEDGQAVVRVERNRWGEVCVLMRTRPDSIRTASRRAKLLGILDKKLRRHLA